MANGDKKEEEQEATPSFGSSLADPAISGVTALAHELLPGLARVTGEKPPAGPLMSVQPEPQATVSPAEGVPATAPADAAKPRETGGVAGEVAEGTPPQWVKNKYGGKGAGGGIKEISTEITIGPQVPKEFNAAKLAHLRNSALVQDLGLQARANAIGAQIDILRDFDHRWEVAFNETAKEIDQIVSEAEEEKNAMGELMDRVSSNRINPGQFFANAGRAATWAAALAAGAGAMSSNGGPNSAYNIIKHAIDRNVEAQTVNARLGIQAVYAQAQFINTIKGLANTKANYANFLRMGLAGMAQNHMAQAQLGLDETLSVLAARDVWNRFGAMVVDSKINAITALQSKATVKLTSLAALSKLEQYQARRAGMTTAGRPTAGRPPAAGGGGGTQPTSRGQGGSKVNADYLTKLQSGVTEAQKDGRGPSPEALSDLTVNLLRKAPGETTLEDMEAAASVLEQLGESSAAALVRQVPQDDYQGADVIPRKTMRVGDKDLPYIVTDSAIWEKTKGKARTELLREVQAPLKQWQLTQKAHDLLGTLNAGPDGWLKYFRRYHGDFKFVPGSGPKVQKDVAALELIKQDLMEYIRQAEGTRNALNMKHEVERYAKRTGLGRTGLESFFDLIQNRADIYQAVVEPALEKSEDGVGEIESTHGIRFIRGYD